MVHSNTGVYDPDNPENDLDVPESNGVIFVSEDEDESDDQQDATFNDNYQPLPTDEFAESNTGDSDSEDVTNDTLPHITPIEETLVKEVWSAPSPKEVDIEMDNKKVDEVKLAMANVTLPSSAIPEWAMSVPEDSWKQLIYERLQKAQLGE